MANHFDALETRAPEDREAAFFRDLRALLDTAGSELPALTKRLYGFPIRALTDRAALSRIPVLRKPELMEMQAADPPFGGLVRPAMLKGSRVFLSPGPVFEPQGPGADPWSAARALFAAGVRAGDIVHNSFSYHMTPGAFILDEGARALGCLVFPAGVGDSEAQIDVAARLKPSVYTGTPDFLKIMIEKAAQQGLDLSSFRRALVSGGALFPSLREYYRNRGIMVLQAYATADLGVVAYESADENGDAYPGLVVNESCLVEIVRPGTDDPVADGEVGEIVVTTLNPAYPLIRFGTGDLSAVMAGTSPCGRTNRRIQGWMGRADQRVKIKGLFVDPRQIADLTRRHPEIGRARLVVTRHDDQDSMELVIEPASGDMTIGTAPIAQSLTEITRLKGKVTVVARDSLPNDGKVIADERDYAS